MKITTFEQFVKIMNEGLIRTYDISSLESILKTQLRFLNLTYEFKTYKNNTFDLTIFSTKTKSKRISQIDLDTVIRFTYCYGYFPSYMELCFVYKIDDKEMKFNYDECLKYINNKEVITLTLRFESNFDEYAKNIPKKLYHVCRYMDLFKIMKIGLVPKAKNKLSTHPARIYLSDKIEDAHEIMKRFKKNDKDENIEIKYEILEIDKNKCGDIKFYEDPNFTDGGIYTHENIHPSAIKIYK